MSHITNGDNPNPYPSGDLTPGTIGLLLALAAAALAWVLNL
jgi:hypothetical protein